MAEAFRRRLILDREYFEQGETVEAFLAGMGDSRGKFEQLLAESELPEEVKSSSASLPRDLNVLVIGEPWSGDVLYFLPPLLRLAQEKGWQVRVFHRDQYPDLILPYRKDGLYRSIPVFVFYDQDFKELAHWIERPREATRVIDEESLKLRRLLREERRQEWREEELDELTQLIDSAAKSV